MKKILRASLSIPMALLFQISYCDILQLLLEARDTSALMKISSLFFLLRLMATKGTIQMISMIVPIIVNDVESIVLILLKIKNGTTRGNDLPSGSCY